MVVLAVGVKPRDEVAKAAGIVCPGPGGIQVDAELCTNDLSVFAIGECARYSGQCYGLIAPGYAMAEVLAERLAGKDAKFSSIQLNTRLNVGSQEIVVMGESTEPENAARAGKLEALVSRNAAPGTYRRLVLRDGHLVGAASIGPWLELPRLQEAISGRALLRRDERKRFVKGGALWGKARAVSLATWSESATVCACTGVSYGALCRARAQGATTVDELCARTRAASMCGTCRPLLVAFASAEAPAPVPRFRLGFALMAASVLVAIGVGLRYGPIALGESVRGRFEPDLLWRDPLARQITGFGLAGSCALSAAVLTLRKRWRRLKGVDYGKSRALHAALGLFTLALVGAHTGLRWGRGLDFALVVSLLSMMALGAGTALLVSSERLLQSPIGQTLRRSGVRLHLWLAWPIPVLLVFHVLRSYYF
jgi:nitrite reductase (NADH) large subunit